MSDIKFLDNNHPITPPPELIAKWASQAVEAANCSADVTVSVATQAARWGADMELEACVEWMGDSPVIWRGDPETHPGFYLREARRPKPPSLQDQALDDLERISALLMENKLPCDTGNIRRALESLPD